MEPKNRTPLVINIILLIIVGGLGWYFYESGNTNGALTSFAFCAFVVFMIFKNTRPSGE
jgi:hypothetical protein